MLDINKIINESLSIILEGTISNYRDNKHFKGADIKYPDNVFQNISSVEEVKIAIDFYTKIINLFNKTFKRNLRISSQIVGADNFKIIITYETNTSPEYFAYPTEDMDNPTIQNHIDKYVPLTSLRHELFHEIFEPLVVDYFDLVNNIDNSKHLDNIEDIQRDRAFNYSLQSIFYERLVENLERNPDFKDTFPMSHFMIDVVNRIIHEFKDENKIITKKDLLSKINDILVLEDKTHVKFLLKTIPDLFNKLDFDSIKVSDLKQYETQLGKTFEQYFNIEKNILDKQIEFDVYNFQKLFMEEYEGVKTRLNKMKQK